jgi:hypothetical protein
MPMATCLSQTTSDVLRLPFRGPDVAPEAGLRRQEPASGSDPLSYPFATRRRREPNSRLLRLPYVLRPYGGASEETGTKRRGVGCCQKVGLVPVTRRGRESFARYVATVVG